MKSLPNKHVYLTEEEMEKQLERLKNRTKKITISARGSDRRKEVYWNKYGSIGSANIVKKKLERVVVYSRA